LIREGITFYSSRRQQSMEVAMIRKLAAVAGVVLIAQAVPGYAGAVRSQTITAQGTRHGLSIQGAATKAVPSLGRAMGGPTTPPGSTLQVFGQAVTNPSAAAG
jgi:hypothetical protein